MDKKPDKESSAFASSCGSLKRKRPPMIEIPNVLQEIHTNGNNNDCTKPQFQVLTPKHTNVSFSGIGVGVSAIKGKKKLMEDRHKIVSNLHGKSNQGFFGVYDGHGGKKAVEFVAENLHSNVLEMMVNRNAGNTSKEEAVKAGYLKTDQDFLKQGSVGGSCCVTVLIEEQEVVVSNLGDCRAVLCRGVVAEALTEDHRAERGDECKRIEDKGGYVEIHRGAWRVHGILSVSRSIGDAHLKDWVPAEPDTKILKLSPDMGFLILATDGLWDKVGNQEAVDLVISLWMPEKLGTAGNTMKDIDVDNGCGNVSPPSKLPRISFIKPQMESRHSPSYKKKVYSWKDKEDGFACENESPPAKSRRISLVKAINIKTETPKENSSNKIRNASLGLEDACKELVNLAVSKGSLDDITVMIIDLNHFRINS